MNEELKELTESLIAMKKELVENSELQTFRGHELSKKNLPILLDL